VCDHGFVEAPALLVFRRPGSYVDRGVRYLVEIDGGPLAPRLDGLSSVEAEVAAGEHSVRVSAHDRRYFEAHIDVEPGQTRELHVVPGPLLSVFSRQPRLRDERCTRVSGPILRRTTPIADPKPRHLS
jgi:hypothetical protein